ncbi:hypothetical protein L228DRAFT_16797 [Xylona heveae TC161]|uniref:Uncharacterized protein n=1 Tax=Xylona heveae (strain CBS 132557 / TC161) TaxID=1328760 RepID=A0A165JVE6_XYLHT|nr:hypothetical protein L228DRAFT_16797 [Xylona heveae TC161]KZF26680.1 hypothetical protein L228DRAFT_16797 [Xylona heveae TC161]
MDHLVRRSDQQIDDPNTQVSPCLAGSFFLPSSFHVPCFFFPGIMQFSPRLTRRSPGARSRSRSRSRGFMMLRSTRLYILNDKGPLYLRSITYYPMLLLVQSTKYTDIGDHRWRTELFVVVVFVVVSYLTYLAHYEQRSEVQSTSIEKKKKRAKKLFVWLRTRELVA